MPPKFHSAVIFLVGNLISSIGFAQAPATTGRSCDSVLLEWKAETDEKKKSFLQTLVSSCYGASSGTSSGDCSSAPADFNSAREKAAVACGKAGIAGCEEAFRDCQPTNMKDTARAARTSTDPNEPINISALKKELKNCPALASADREKLEAKLKESEVKSKEAKKKIPELTDKLNDVETKANEKIGNLKKEMATNATNHSKDLLKMKSDRTAREEALKNEMLALHAKIDEAESAGWQIQVSEADAHVKFEEAKTQIDLNCHKSASDEVGRMQTEALVKLKSGVLDHGSQSNIFAKSGGSDRESWQREANKYYIWCLEGKPTSSSKASANRGYKLALKQAKMATQSIKKKIKTLKDAMEGIMNKGPCGQAIEQANGSNGGETKMCTNAKEFKEAMEAAHHAYRDNQENLTEQATQTIKAAEREHESKARALEEAEREAADEATRLANLTQAVALKGPDGGSSRALVTEAFSLMGLAADKARFVVQCAEKGEGTSCGKSSTCYSNAKGFLERTGVIEQERPAIATLNLEPITNDPTQPAATAQRGAASVSAGTPPTQSTQTSPYYPTSNAPKAISEPRAPAP